MSGHCIRHHNPFLSICIAALLSVIAATAHAAAPDPSTVTITSDNAEFLRDKDTSIYTGDVVVVRGGLTLNGQHLTVKQLEDGNLRAVLKGQPATFHRIPPQNGGSSDDKPVNGHSGRIIYTSSNARITLRGDAKVVRAGDTITSEIIHQYLDSRRTVAEREPGNEQRVEITLHPEDDDGGTANQP